MTKAKTKKMGENTQTSTSGETPESGDISGMGILKLKTSVPTAVALEKTILSK